MVINFIFALLFIGRCVCKKYTITTGGSNAISGKGCYQNDYAARMWSGLIRDYYILGMRLQLSGKKKDLQASEEAWITTPWVNKTQAFDDRLAAATELIKNN